MKARRLKLLTVLDEALPAQATKSARQMGRGDFNRPTAHRVIGRLKSPLLLAALTLTTPLHAQDLLSVYRQALQDNPGLENAKEGLAAVLESQDQAHASAFLPEARFDANINRDYQTIQFSGAAAIGLNGNREFFSGGYSLSITQPLLHYERWVALDQADSRVAQAEAEQNAAEIGLMITVAERYFEVLAAKQNLKFAQAQQQSLQRKLTEAEQRQAVGFLAMPAKA